MVGPKKQDFWSKINILKGNHCILRIQEAQVRQKLTEVRTLASVRLWKFEDGGS